MHTRIKFCGLTRAEDVRLAVELGADYIGLVFAPRSPRRLLLGQARMLRDLVPEEIGVVALVMDNPRTEIEQIVESLQPDLLQFHGGEDDAFAGSFHRPFWKAIAMGGQGESAFASLAASKSGQSPTGIACDRNCCISSIAASCGSRSWARMIASRSATWPNIAGPESASTKLRKRAPRPPMRSWCASNGWWNRTSPGRMRKRPQSPASSHAPSTSSAA